MRLRRPEERGDTIIEVLFAIAVFAMVAIGGMSIMNQGTATAQRSLEITLVRQQIDAQAEAIRYIHQAYVAAYQKGGTPTGIAAEWPKMASISSKGVGSASEFGQVATGSTCESATPIEKPFILNARRATLWSQTPAMTPPEGGTLPPFAHVIYNKDSIIEAVYGLWIEAVPSVGADGPGFVDFHIRACWDSPGSPAPVTLGTIVRLYEPRQ
jgi:type II secretory pathway pseudopilin PulG